MRVHDRRVARASSSWNRSRYVVAQRVPRADRDAGTRPSTCRRAIAPVRPTRPHAQQCGGAHAAAQGGRDPPRVAGRASRRGRSRSAAQPAVSSSTTAPTITRTAGASSPPPASRIAAPIVAAPGPPRERRRRRDERRRHRQVRDVAAAEVGGPHAGEEPARDPGAARHRAAAAAAHERAPAEPDRGAERVLQRRRAPAPGPMPQDAATRSGAARRSPAARRPTREPVGVATRDHHRYTGTSGPTGNTWPSRTVGHRNERDAARRRSRRRVRRRSRPGAGARRRVRRRRRRRPSARDGTRPPARRASTADRCRGPLLASPACSTATCVADVLPTARRKGGDFAEVFVEERSSTSVRLDDGKVEELTTGLDRGAGVRVMQGTSYGYAFSNRLDRGLAARGRRGGERGAPRRRGRRRRRPHRRARARAATAPSGRPPTSRPPTKVGWLREVDDAARGVSPEVHPGRRDLRRLAAAAADRGERRPAGSEEDRPRIRVVAQVVAQARRRDPDGLARARPRAPAWSSSTRTRRPRRGAVRPSAPSRCSTRSPRPRARCRSSSRTAAAGSSSTRPSAIRSRPTRSTRRPRVYRGARRQAVRERADQRRRRRHDPERLGFLRLRRRGRAGAAHGPVHRRRAAGVPPGPDARGEDGRRRRRATAGASPTRTHRSCG